MAYRKPTGAVGFATGTVLATVLAAGSCVASLIVSEINRLSFCLCGYVVFGLCEPTKNHFG
jgi:hypothetical protein